MVQETETNDPYYETVINRKDTILSEKEYEPVLAAIQERERIKQLGQIAKKERENSLIRQLLDVIEEAEDKEAAAAEFIGRWGRAEILSGYRAGYGLQQSELYWAANKVRENRREAKKLINS